MKTAREIHNGNKNRLNLPLHKWLGWSVRLILSGFCWSMYGGRLLAWFIGLLLAKYVFKFHPAIALGCCAGARTTTAALGAIQDAVESETPALGYTVTYAVGNTLLIIWGVAIVLMV